MNYSTLTDEQLLQSAQLAINNSQEIVRQRLSFTSQGIIKNTKRAFIDHEFCYPEDLTFSDFYKLYKRIGAERGFVDRLIDISWVDYPKFLALYGQSNSGDIYRMSVSMAVQISSGNSWITKKSKSHK